ncbi:MAG: Clp protease N-terminal domain-containing protein, partial [Ruthenibacterium lactatiformans]
MRCAAPLRRRRTWAILTLAPNTCWRWRGRHGRSGCFFVGRQVYGYQVGRLLREQVGCGRRTRLSPRDFTPALSKCVDCAVIEAKAVSDGKVEPVHLLAALLEAPATAGRILVQLGVEPAAAAKECGRRMGKFPLFQQ